MKTLREINLELIAAMNRGHAQYLEGELDAARSRIRDLEAQLALRDLPLLAAPGTPATSPPPDCSCQLCKP